MLSYRCSTDKPKRVGRVQFGLVSPEHTRKLSTVQVSDSTIYSRGLPNPCGINDSRMGTVDRRLLCGTCTKDVKTCQGHTGHIELAYPMYHICFFEMCLKTLRCVCFCCSRILVSDAEAAALAKSPESGKARFTAAYASLKTKRKCAHCGLVQPTYVRLALAIRTDWPADMAWECDAERDEFTKPFTARDALSIFSHMTAHDAAVLGFNNECAPKNMILTALLVPPPVARPAIMASEGSRSRGQDDLTIKLQDVLKRSLECENAMRGKHWRTIDVGADLLERIAKVQFEVFTYMNNNIRGQKQSTQRSGAPTKSLTDRLRGKDGRIRGNLMGKRVDFSARSVITPDSCFDVDEVGIPERIAVAMTIPERVTSWNINALSERVARGTGVLFGAEAVITAEGVMINLAHCEHRSKIRLQYGWIVERYLTDGDFVIFNRQPSTHPVSPPCRRCSCMALTRPWRVSQVCTRWG